ncbi:MAG: UDP-N-acetylmuramoyl-tripeptide--D-alanyl-D-alanine ligase [Armatimonadota bacterium]
MEPIKASEVLNACKGELVSGDQEVRITGVSTDTRTLVPGDLFFALTGQTSDGHKFLADAFARGAVGVVVSRKVEAEKLVIRVKNTLVALGDLASYYRGKFSPIVIGVTGSVGKTTTKEMAAAIVSTLGPCLKNPGNFNNEIGLPLTLFNLDRTHKTAVLEMAMRGAGQIAYLAKIARPRIGIITNIYPVHIELLGSLDAVADAKAELLDLLPEGGAAVLNADDPYFDRLRLRTRARVISFGESSIADVRLTSAEVDEQGCCTFSVATSRGNFEVHVPVPGEHNIKDALAAVAVGEFLGISHEAMREALTNFAPPERRSNVLRSRRGVVIIDDTYNASPPSVISALHTLARMQGSRKIAVLGDMLELGRIAEEAHGQVGRVVKELGIDRLVVVGGLAKLISRAAVEAGFSSRSVYEFENSEEAGLAVSRIVRKGDVVLVKGSRAMRMENVVEAIVGS